MKQWKETNNEKFLKTVKFFEHPLTRIIIIFLLMFIIGRYIYQCNESNKQVVSRTVKQNKQSYKRNEIIKSIRQTESKKDFVNLKVESMRVSPTVNTWCLVGANVTAKRTLEHYTISFYAVDKNNKVIDRSVKLLTIMSAGETRYVEFAFYAASCDKITNTRWEPM